MTDKLDDKLVEVITQLQHGLTAVGDKIYQATPQAVDALLAVKQIEGIAEITRGAFWAIILLIGYKFICTSISMMKKTNWENDDDCPRGIASIVLLLTAGGVSFISLMDIYWHLINIWN